MGYPTPTNLPAETICRQIFIPDDPIWLAVYNGLLSSLASPYIWETIGDLTPDEAAERAAQVYYEFVESECYPPPVPNYTEGCRVYKNTTSTLVSGVPLVIPFTTERYDTDSMWSVGAPTRITFTHAGKYIVGGNAQSAAGKGIRQLAIRLNGGSNIAYEYDDLAATAARIMALSTVWSFAAADYIELIMTITDDASRNLPSANYYTPEFFAQRIG